MKRGTKLGRFLAAALVFSASPVAGQAVCSNPGVLEDTDLGPLGRSGAVGNLRDLELDPQGNRYLIFGTPWVAVFDSAGGPVRQIGQYETGTEFRSLPTTVGWTGD